MDGELVRRVILLILFLLSAGAAVAVPSLPTEIYGQFIFYNSNISVGTNVDAYANGTHCGRYTIEQVGYFGFFTCRGDDPSTERIEGGRDGDLITVRVGSDRAQVFSENITWEEGTFKFLNLSLPYLSCGDNFCDFREGCAQCELDCGVCNTTSNQTVNGTNGTGTNGTGSGTGSGGAGGGSGGGGGAGAGGAMGGAAVAGEAPSGGECSESWTCTDWGNCTPYGYQTRVCTDANACGTMVSKPAENQTCVYVPTCFDGFRNGDETGIDCGGSCGPCPSCFDGIQNCHRLESGEICEQGVDCGGPCKPCNHCFDGIQDYDEEGPDCGGSCEKKCSLLRMPILEFPKLICTRTINPFNIYLLLFLIIIVLGTVGVVLLYERQLRQLKKKKKLDDVQRAKQAFAIRRRMWLFVTSVTVVTIMLLLYYYVFGLCEGLNVRYLWVLALLLLLSPLIIHRVMRFYEYNERAKMRALGLVDSTHHSHLLHLMNLQDQYLMQIEQRLQAILYSMSRDEKLQAYLDEYPALKKIYRDLAELYTQYKERKEPYKLEKDLCDAIYDIEENEHFVKLAEQEPRIKLVHEKLKAIYALYEEKEELYTELDADEKKDA